MGRRDEPELDELSRLLRRLETMDAPKQAAPRKVEPESSGEYVGALRGAAPAKVGDVKRASEFDLRHAQSDESLPRGNTSNSKAIVVGAIVAAVISSITATTMVLWSNGDKRSEEGRLSFYATKDQGEAHTGTNHTPDQGRAADGPQQLLQRADTYLRSGKPDEARIVLEAAARAGSGVAALTLGAMYDPGRVSQFANLGIKSDPTVARAWYERAKDLGVAEANDRLAELAAR
jgi:TPR repeat protein